MNKDNWKHRTENMTCKTCMWFNPKEPPTNGRCRRHAPTMNGFPVVFPTDWCGDHKIDEMKVGNSVTLETWEDHSGECADRHQSDCTREGEKHACWIWQCPDRLNFEVKENE